MGKRTNRINNANISIDAPIVGFSDNYITNERFEIRKVSILSYDECGNRFHFNKQLIDNKDYQLDMLPVVGFHDGEGFTGHDEKAVPYGAIIPNSARWEYIDGKEYKVVDVAFWKRRYSEINDIEACNQSMEIVDITGVYNKELGIFEVENYTYDALCVLGKDVKPAYSKAKVFNLSDIKDEFNIFKSEFNDLFNLNKTEEGGDNVDQEKLETIKEEKNYNNDDSSDTEEQQVEEQQVEEQQVEEQQVEEQEHFELSQSDIRQCILNQLNPVREDGTIDYKYWLCEVFDSYFICIDELDKFRRFYKVKFDKNNETDTVTVYMEDKEQVYLTYLNEEEKEFLKQKDLDFNELTEKYSKLKEEVDELRSFKCKVEEKQAKEKAEKELKAKEDEIKKFASKLSKKEISEQIDDVNNFSLEEIRNKLSVTLANKLLSENEVTFSDNTIMDIDNTDKVYSRSDRLLAELKNKRNN